MHNILQTVLENQFEKFSITAIIYGCAIDAITPKLQPKGTWLERFSLGNPESAFKRIK